MALVDVVMGIGPLKTQVVLLGHNAEFRRRKSEGVFVEGRFYFESKKETKDDCRFPQSRVCGNMVR